MPHWQQSCPCTPLSHPGTREWGTKMGKETPPVPLGTAEIVPCDGVLSNPGFHLLSCCCLVPARDNGQCPGINLTLLEQGGSRQLPTGTGCPLRGDQKLVLDKTPKCKHMYEICPAESARVWSHCGCQILPRPFPHQVFSPVFPTALPTSSYL